MEEFWARLYRPSSRPGPDYWTYYAERLVHLADMPDRGRILDIGTCDGNVLFKAMERVAARAFGVGIDIDKDDFYAGFTEVIQHGWKGKISFAQMDANALGFQTETFDAVLTNFLGFDDFYDFERMQFTGSDDIVSEILRVLKPGGQVGIGSWVKQSDIDWIEEAFMKYLPEIFSHGGKGISDYSRENPEGQKAILQNGGFENIRVYVDTADFVSPDLGTWWRQMERAAGEYFRQVNHPVRLTVFKEQVYADLDQIRFTQGIRFSKSVSFAFGVKPV